MNTKNINKKIKNNKEKTVVLSGRIQENYFKAFELIAKINGATTSELFKATIQECIDSYIKSDVMVDYKTAKEFMVNSREKLGNMSLVSQKLDSLPYSKEIEKIPLALLLENIPVQFTYEEDGIKEKLGAYKRLYDSLYNEMMQNELGDYESEMREQEESFEKWQKEQNILSENENIYLEYYSYDKKDIPHKLELEYKKLPLEFIREKDLLTKPFILDEDGNRIYNDNEIIDFWKSNIHRKYRLKKFKDYQINSIDDVIKLFDEQKAKEEVDKKEFDEISKTLNLSESICLLDLNKLESKPFTSKYINKDINDEAVINYWKAYKNDISFFKNKEINKQSIQDYLLLRNDLKDL